MHSIQKYKYFLLSSTIITFIVVILIFILLFLLSIVSDTISINFINTNIHINETYNLFIYSFLLIALAYIIDKHKNGFLKQVFSKYKLLKKYTYYTLLSYILLSLILLTCIVLTGGNINSFLFKPYAYSLKSLVFSIAIIIFLVNLLFKEEYFGYINYARIIYGKIRNGNNYHLIILMCIFLISWGYSFSEKIIIDGDGVGYYSYIRSVIMDYDLDFTNEFLFLKSWKSELPYPWDQTATNYVPNPYSIGPAILWSPFFLAALICAKFLNIIGYQIATDGYSPIFILFVAAGTKIYAFAGLIFLYRALKLFFNNIISLLSILFIWLATPLSYYSHFSLFMSHGHSFFAISLLMYYVLKESNNNSKRKWVISGLLVGLVSLCRWQDSVFFLLPILLTFLQYKKVSTIISNLKTFILNLLLYTISFFAVISLQLIIFLIIYGYWFGIPQGNRFLLPYPAFTIEILFSPLHGLIHWHPIILFSIIGIIYKVIKNEKKYICFLAIFIINWLFNATITQWWAGHSFGMRRLINCLPIFAFGLSAFIEYLSKRKFSMYIFIFLFILLTTINLLMIKAYILQIIPHEDYVNLIELIKSAASVTSYKEILCYTLLTVIFYYLINDYKKLNPSTHTINSSIF